MICSGIRRCSGHCQSHRAKEEMDMGVKEPWEIAWERDKHEVGRQVHISWAAEKIRQGFADHVLIPNPDKDDYSASMRDQMRDCGYRVGTMVCHADKGKHHPDMLDYDDLAPHIQEYDLRTGVVAYEIGFKAGWEARDVSKPDQ